MSLQGGHIYFEKSQALSRSYQLGDDPRPLQIAFAVLFDEAAQAIYLAGSDLDEVLVERFFLVRIGQTVQQVQASFVADAKLLEKSVLDQFGITGISKGTKELEIVAIKIVARHDPQSQA